MVELRALLDEIGDGALYGHDRQTFPNGDLVGCQHPSSVANIGTLGLLSRWGCELAACGPEVTDAVQRGRRFARDHDRGRPVLKSIPGEARRFGG